MVKLKRILRSRRFWKTEAWIGGFLLGIPFFVSGKNLFEYLSSLSLNNIMLAVALTTILGLFIEMYVKEIFKR